MRSFPDFTTLAATALAGLFMVVLVLFAPGLALAADGPVPFAHQPVAIEPPPQFDLRPYLDETDELATLDALHTALTEVGDGNTYVWHRRNGRISAIMQPTLSFKDDADRVCRHLVIMLVSGHHTRKTEAVACRLPGGRWQMDG
jgi:hypothetical protein